MTEANIKISVITPSIRPKGLEIVRECLLNQTFKDFEWLVDINWTGKHDLNASFNRLIKRANGELVIFLQDYIKIAPEGLQRFWEAYQRETKLYTAPVGKSKKEDYSDVIWDWRKNNYSEVGGTFWEIDWACAPKRILYDIGGFDETLDQYWSCDNVNIGYRLQLKGYKFENIDNPAVAFDHDAFEEHPFRKDYHPNFNNERMQAFERGLTIDYLK